MEACEKRMTDRPKLKIEYSSKMDVSVKKEKLIGNALHVLIGLGLTRYEVYAYNVLLKVKSATAREVCDMVHIPAGRLYSVLNSLVDKGFAKYRGYRPRYYEAIPRKINNNGED